MEGTRAVVSQILRRRQRGALQDTQTAHAVRNIFEGIVYGTSNLERQYQFWVGQYSNRPLSGDAERGPEVSVAPENRFESGELQTRCGKGRQRGSLGSDRERLRIRKGEIHRAQRGRFS